MNNSKLIAGGLFIAGLTLYISALAPSVVTLFDDSLEFQLVTYRLGIAHPTGYPLYMLLGKLFTFIPIGNVAYRVNLMSAVFGAATVALLYLLILRMATPKKKSSTAAIEFPENSVQSAGDTPSWPVHLGGVIGALLPAVGLVFWQQATIAEVYTLNAFFVVVLLLLVTRETSPHFRRGQGGNGVKLRNSALPLTPSHREGPSRQEGELKASPPLGGIEGGQQSSDSTNLTALGQGGVYWAAFLAGLSLTHHRTMVLLLPALAIYLFLIYGKQLFNPKTVLLSVFFGLLPLLLYLYLPLRGHIGSLDGTYQNTWAGFWQQISAGGYGTFIFSNPFAHERDIVFYWNLLADQFYTTIPGLIGIVYLFNIGRQKHLALTGLAFLTYLPFNLFYNVTDIEVFFIPIFLLWAIWSGLGATFLLRTATTLKYVSWRRPIVVTLLAIFAFMLFQLFQTNRAIISRNYTWEVHDYGLDMLQQPLDDNSAIVGILGEMTLLRYFQQTENRRPDIETVAADLETDRLIAVENLLAAGQTVYLTRQLPGASERWSLNAVGPLIRVDPEPVTIPPDFSVALNQTVTPEITLLGYTVSRPSHTGQGPDPVRLTLFWQAIGAIAADLKVSARLLTPSDEVKAVVDAVPVHFAYPTTAWRPGEIISDVYDLALPVATPPGQYTPLIIWYNPAQNATEVGRVELGPVMIE